MSVSHLSQCSHTIRIHPATARPILVQMAGDLTAGILLTQIDFWFRPDKRGQRKVRVQRHGDWWVAKTREAWMAETGLGAAQYKRAIAVLKRKGFIEVRKMRFGGLAISHIRLLPAYYVARQQIPPDGRKSTSRSGGPRPIGRAISDPSCTEITNRDHRQSSCEDARARADAISDPEMDRGREANTEEDRSNTQEMIGDLREATLESTDDPLGNIEERRLTPAEIPATRTASGTAALLPPNPSKTCVTVSPTITSPAAASGLGGFWVERSALVLSGYQKPLTGKELGQLKQLAKCLGAQTRAVIDCAVKNWWQFAARAGTEAGTLYPTLPHVGFLLKHHAVVVRMLDEFEEFEKRPAQAQAEAPPAPMFRPTMPPPAEEPHKMTDEEFAEMMADLEDNLKQ